MICAAFFVEVLDDCVVQSSLIYVDQVFANAYASSAAGAANVALFAISALDHVDRFWR